MEKERINKNAYSEESKRSVGHEFLGEYYEDIKYNCSKCKEIAIFLASEQKKAYEVRKEYMWVKRQLCDNCWKEMRSIKAELYRIESEYCKNKAISLASKVILTEWLELLELYPKFGKKANSARIIFVKKHLNLIGYRRSPPAPHIVRFLLSGSTMAGSPPVMNIDPNIS